MPAYRVYYNADGRKYNILILADNESHCRKQMKSVIKEMGFDKAEIVRIKVIEE